VNTLTTYSSTVATIVSGVLSVDTLAVNPSSTGSSNCNLVLQSDPNGGTTSATVTNLNLSPNTNLNIDGNGGGQVTITHVTAGDSTSVNIDTAAVTGDLSGVAVTLLPNNGNTQSTLTVPSTLTTSGDITGISGESKIVIPAGGDFLNAAPSTTSATTPTTVITADFDVTGKLTIGNVNIVGKIDLTGVLFVSPPTTGSAPANVNLFNSCAKGATIYYQIPGVTDCHNIPTAQAKGTIIAYGSQTQPGAFGCSVVLVAGNCNITVKVGVNTAGGARRLLSSCEDQGTFGSTSLTYQTCPKVNSADHPTLSVVVLLTTLFISLMYVL